MKKLFILGDSISIHYRPVLAEMTKGKWSFEINEREKNLAEIDLNNPDGLNGGDSARVLGKIESYQRQGILDYDAMLLNCGLHDIKRDKETGSYQVALEDYKANLEKITASLATQKGKLFWVRTTPVEDERHNSKCGINRFAADVDAYNQAADAIMQRAGVPMIDLFAFTLNLSGEKYIDHVHYNDSVRAAQAAFIAGHIWNE